MLEYSPPQKNLPLPIIISAALPSWLDVPLESRAPLHNLRHSLSTVSSAGLKAWFITSCVRRFSSRLCRCKIQRVPALFPRSNQPFSSIVIYATSYVLRTLTFTCEGSRGIFDGRKVKRVRDFRVPCEHAELGSCEIAVDVRLHMYTSQLHWTTI